MGTDDEKTFNKIMNILTFSLINIRQNGSQYSLNYLITFRVFWNSSIKGKHTSLKFPV
jgi:hypothetical protein